MMDKPGGDFLDELHRLEQQDPENASEGVRALARLVAGFYSNLVFLGMKEEIAAALTYNFMTWHLEWASRQPKKEPTKKPKSAPRKRKDPDVQD
jgi:hypothetical protein